jgi:VWFA-related protein
MKIRISIAVLLAALSAVAVPAQQAPQAAPPAAQSAPQAPQAPQALQAPQAPPDQAPLTFRIEINYVEVDAIVIDALGNPVNDLTAADFEVLEDGKVQSVTAFSLVNLPIERAERPLFAAAPIEPDVQTNTNAEGRIYLIVLDDLHTSFSNTPRVKRALREFFERNFGVNDLAAIVYTSGRGTDAQDFTNNRRLLLESVDKFAGNKLRSEVLETLEARARPRDPSLPAPGDPLEQERAFNARTMMSTVRKLAEFMGGVRGRRKAMMLVSEGISYNIYDVINNSSASIVMQETQDAIAAATRANVAIYAIDPRGLSAFEEAVEIAGTPADDRTGSIAGGFLDSQRLSQQSLRVLAAETGGFAAVNRNDFADAFARVVRENSSYYVLGYYSTNERRDGRYRRLEVRVKRAGLQVRSRKGYIAPRGRAPETRVAAPAVNPLTTAVNEALGSPIPINGIPINVFAAAYKGTAPNAVVVLSLEMSGDQFRFDLRDGIFNDRVEVTFTSVDTSGDIHAGARHSLSMTMRPETVNRLRERGFRVISKAELPPGRYQMRIAAAEEGNNLSGSVLYDLQVPDFYKPAFSMSGVSLTSQFAAATPTVFPENPLADFLPAAPTTAREFLQDDEVALFTEFYENTPGAPPHQLDLSTTVRAEDGRVVFADTEERSSTDLQGASGGHGYQIRIPLKGLAPGTYVIRVEGRSRVGTDAVAGRDVLIRVR